MRYIKAKRTANLMLCLMLGISYVAAQQNIVPNPSFEEYSNYPLGWFYKGSDFSRVIKYWSSPTAASPDVFGPKVRIPRQWAEKGFGETKPYDGESMIGVTTYGCEGGKPHCREYAQIQLTEPLVIGQRYKVSFWVAPIHRSLRCDKLGVYFSEEEIREPTDDPLFFNPHVKADQLLAVGTNGWQEVSGEFQADKTENYILIGNFYPDEMVKTRDVVNHLNFGYYYIDKIEVKKMEPIIDVPLPSNEWSQIKMEPGKVVRLKNIFFDHDKAELLPRSFFELDKLYDLLKQNPTMQIEVRGHTDAVGEQSYNLPLSEKRAKAVVDYLLNSGISTNRLHHQGYGASMPIAENDTEIGRQENRRVEFLILSK